MAKYKKRINTAYGLSAPLVDVMPEPIKAQRRPTTADNGYPIGQTWINVNSASPDFNDVWMLTSVTATAANWEPIGNDTEGGPAITEYVVDANGGAAVNYTTIQSAIDAVQLVGGTAMIWVRPGTYTENLTLYDGLIIRGDNIQSIITGVHTPPATGAVIFQDLYLTSATDIITSAVAGTTRLRFFNCTANCTNGYMVDCANWTGPIDIFKCNTASTTDGVVNNNLGSSTIVIEDSYVGQGATVLATGGGTLAIASSRIGCGITLSGATAASITRGSYVAGTLTTGGTSATIVYNSSIVSGVNTAVTHSSAGTLAIYNSIINSSNATAIGGAGAGILTLSGVEFPSSSNLSATLTLDYLPDTRSTKLICGDAVYPVDELTNEYNVIQGFAATTETIAFQINAIEGNMEVAATASILQPTGVYGYCVQDDGSAITSTAAGVEGHLNLLETDNADLPPVYAFAVKGYLDATDTTGIPAAMTAGVGSIVEYNTPFNAKAYGFVASRLNAGGGAGTAGQAAYGVLQGTVAAADWLYGVDLYNGGTGVAYGAADIRLQNQAFVAIDTEGARFSGEWACRSCDPTNTHIYSWDSDPIMQIRATNGGVPSGATGTYNLMYCQDRTTLIQFILGTGQTIIAPLLENDGLLISLDLSNSEGAEYYFGHTTRSRHTFVIGTSPAFFVEATFKVADCGTSDPLWLGFRLLGAPNAAYTNYTDAYTIGLRNTTAADVVVLGSNLNGTGWNYQNSGDSWLDGEVHTIRVNVSATGVCTALIDGVAPSTPLAFTFDNGDTVIPFIHHLFAAGGAPAAIHIQTLSCGLQAWT